MAALLPGSSCRWQTVQPKCERDSCYPVAVKIVQDSGSCSLATSESPREPVKPRVAGPCSKVCNSVDLQ